MNPFRRKSKNTAKDRLRLILIHDRIELTPGKMEAFKEDIRAVLRKHLEMDIDDFEITVNRKKDSMALEADIPYRNPK